MLPIRNTFISFNETPAMPFVLDRLKTCPPAFIPEVAYRSESAAEVCFSDISTEDGLSVNGDRTVPLAEGHSYTDEACECNKDREAHNMREAPEIAPTPLLPVKNTFVNFQLPSSPLGLSRGKTCPSSFDPESEIAPKDSAVESEGVGPEGTANFQSHCAELSSLFAPQKNESAPTKADRDVEESHVYASERPYPQKDIGTTVAPLTKEEKEVRKLEKKLREVTNLETRLVRGERLDPLQLSKVQARSDLEDAINTMKALIGARFRAEATRAF